MAYQYKKDDAPFIDISGKRYSTGYSQHNYDDDERTLVHGAKQKAEADTQYRTLESKLNKEITDRTKDVDAVRKDMFQSSGSLDAQIRDEEIARTNADNDLQKQIDIKQDKGGIIDGNLIVRCTDGKKRIVVFDPDGKCSWHLVP